VLESTIDTCGYQPEYIPTYLAGVKFKKKKSVLVENLGSQFKFTLKKTRLSNCLFFAGSFMHENCWLFDVSEIPGTNGSLIRNLDSKFLKNRNRRLLKSNSHTTHALEQAPKEPT
jgi:hypothetical protein